MISAFGFALYSGAWRVRVICPQPAIATPIFFIVFAGTPLTSPA